MHPVMFVESYQPHDVTSAAYCTHTHTHTHTRGRTVKPELLPLPLLLVDAVLLRQLPQPSTAAPAPPAAVIPGPTPFIVAAADCLRRLTPAVADAAAAAESSADQSPV